MMRSWVAYRDLVTGDRFRFVYGVGVKPPELWTSSTAIYVKQTDGWFTDDNGRRFRTGPMTAVKLIAS